jgi:putative transcriptional regulator
MAKIKKTKPSRILAETHEEARELFEHGFISARRMKQYDALCLPPVPDYTPQKVKALRKNLHISQAVLAVVTNTSVSTVHQWESGAKRPGGPSARLLDLLERKGLEAVL